jgi:hypothetical protein
VLIEVKAIVKREDWRKSARRYGSHGGRKSQTGGQSRNGAKYQALKLRWLNYG